MSQSLTDSRSILLSPDAETFSTPPTTPGPFLSAKTIIAPSLSRRSSRPTSIHIDHQGSDWNPDIELLTTSPEVGKTIDNRTQLHDSNVPSLSANDQAPMPHHQKPTESPCFVHSHLDKGAQLTDWLKAKQSYFENGDVGVAKSLQHLSSPGQSSTFSPQTSAFDSGNESDGEFVGSLTKRLAETAVGVREMSKQLGMHVTESSLYTCLFAVPFRTSPRAIEYPECSHRHQSSG